MFTIQFETVVTDGVIHIPEQYTNLVPTVSVNVTLVISESERLKFKTKSKDKPSGIDEFPAILNTTGFVFNREEANERR